MSSWSEVPDGYSVHHGDTYCQVRSYGRMSTWRLDSSVSSYSIKVNQYDPCHSALQMGFCGDGYKVPQTLFTCSEKFCGTVFYGTGDDKAKDSVAYDPIRRLSWLGDKKGVHNTVRICEGDIIYVERTGDVVQFYKNAHDREICSLFLPDFDNPRPCVSVHGDITINLYLPKQKSNNNAMYNQGTQSI